MLGPAVDPSRSPWSVRPRLRRGRVRSGVRRSGGSSGRTRRPSGRCTCAGLLVPAPATCGDVQDEQVRPGLHVAGVDRDRVPDRDLADLLPRLDAEQDVRRPFSATARQHQGVPGEGEARSSMTRATTARPMSSSDRPPGAAPVRLCMRSEALGCWFANSWLGGEESVGNDHVDPDVVPALFAGGHARRSRMASFDIA